MQYNIVRKCQKTRQKSIKIYTGRKTQTTKAAVPDFVAFNDTRSANEVDAFSSYENCAWNKKQQER